jgi:hypothetical protein
MVGVTHQVQPGKAEGQNGKLTRNGAETKDRPSPDNAPPKTCWTGLTSKYGSVAIAVLSQADCMRSDILATRIAKSKIFWNLMLYNLIDGDEHFGAVQYSYLQDRIS